MEPQAPIRELAISIHALREEGDRWATGVSVTA